MSPIPARSAPPPESDRVPPAVFWAGFLALAIFGGTVGITEWAHQLWLRHLGPRQGLPAQLGQPTINDLYQMPFPLQRQERERREAKLRQLHSYGWVDRTHGRIHIPIEQAEAQLIRQAGGGRAP